MPRRQERGSPRCIFPGYRYCGPACSGPGAPTNPVDNCCRRHDRCLEQGVSPCRCDTEFINCLRAYMNPHTLMGRQAALMYRVMQVRRRWTCGRSQLKENRKPS
ncbi:phospholipase [Bacillus sp. V5-8f]|uniref:phospholipase n=1 Tax=Bacillus sp. V5-8f TaxID=2053044 RepID=UPI000C757A41|nr:phospholipase [Bacillus sp. V5-8f]PLT35816.1 phospholipase [Bacillus sp. V5-8f]